jgi:pyrroloquinoline quinone biosynthesis protein D
VWQIVAGRVLPIGVCSTPMGDFRESRPRLAAKARLRRDTVRGGWLLLYPERGLTLNDSAAAVVRLCDGEQTVEAIVSTLAIESGRDRAEIEADVKDVLRTLASRRLLAG